MRSIKSEEGMTLLEVLVGIVILMVIAVPLLSFTITAANTSKVNDLHIAYALLRGESEIMYQKQVVPSKNLSVNIGGIVYLLSCSTDNKDSDVVSWSMNVKKINKFIAGTKGLLYEPVPKKN